MNTRIRLPNPKKARRGKKKNKKERKGAWGRKEKKNLFKKKKHPSAPEVKNKTLKHVIMLVVRTQLWLARGKGDAKSARPLSKYLH